MAGAGAIAVAADRALPREHDATAGRTAALGLVFPDAALLPPLDGRGGATAAVGLDGRLHPEALRP